MRFRLLGLIDPIATLASSYALSDDDALRVHRLISDTTRHNAPATLQIPRVNTYRFHSLPSRYSSTAAGAESSSPGVTTLTLSSFATTPPARFARAGDGSSTASSSASSASESLAMNAGSGEATEVKDARLASVDCCCLPFLPVLVLGAFDVDQERVA